MATIETVYRCRIDYEYDFEGDFDPDDVISSVDQRITKLGQREPKVDIGGFDGCAACGPYVELESESLAAVTRLAGRIERYIQRRKGFKLT